MRIGLNEYSRIVEGTYELPPWENPTPYEGDLGTDPTGRIASLIRDGCVEIRGGRLWKKWEARRGVLPEPKIADREDSRGYCTIRLTLDGDSLMAMTHRVITTYYYGPIPSGMQVNHRNGIKNDNRIRNLEVVYPQENAKHAADTGLTKGVRGNSNSNATLSDEDVAGIILGGRVGESRDVIAENYGISKAQVSRILNGTRRPLSFGVYQILADKTANHSLGDVERLMAATLGLCGEAGEVADQIKKFYAHGHDYDVDKIKKEASDVLWYLAEICTVLGMSMDDVAWANIEKLKRRYPEGFSAHKSRHRDPEDT